MINWLVPLYMGTLLLMLLLPSFCAHTSIDSYVHGNKLSGIGSGSRFILARLISCSTLFLTVFSVLKLGILGGICLLCAELFCFFIFLLISLRFPEHKRNAPLMLLCQEKPNSLEKKYLFIVLTLISAGNFILQLELLNSLLGETELHVSVFLVGLFCLTYAGLGGYQALNKGTKLLITYIFMASAMIAIILFLEKGIKTTYLDFLSHPINSSLNSTVTVKYFITLIICRIAQNLFDYSLWISIDRIKPNKRKMVTFLSVFCYFSIILTFLSLTVFGISQNIPLDQYSDFLLQVLVQYNSNFLLNLYVLNIYAIVILHLSLTVHGFVTLYISYSRIRFPETIESKIINKGYLVCLIYIVMNCSLYFALDLSLFQYIQFFGAILISLAIPAIIIFFRSLKTKIEASS